MKLSAKQVFHIFFSTIYIMRFELGPGNETSLITSTMLPAKS